MALRWDDRRETRVAPRPAVPAPRAHAAAISASRRTLLDAVGDTDDLTFIRGLGNRGDELIWAGTRALLADRPYREVDLHTLDDVRGHTAILTGGGGWCRAYHGTMPGLLAAAEARFARVIVFPSSFDPTVDAVAAALRRTRAVVLAREHTSFRLLRELCDVRFAHDTAFFADLTDWYRRGAGVLHAYRTDREALGMRPLPADNLDVSTTCTSLEQWLATIARYAVVRTDRAHVMIAAARLGKRVHVRPSSYHKVPALAAQLGYDFDVRLAGTSRVRSLWERAQRHAGAWRAVRETPPPHRP